MNFPPKRSTTVIQQLEKPTTHQQKLSSPSTGGLVIAIVIIATWVTSLILLLSVDISNFNILTLSLAMLWQAFLYTGLFITTHDAMHGAVFPANNKINHFIGSLCLTLYGFLPYQKLLRKHWMHHHHPASDKDPDFHDGEHKNLFAWYFYFMKNYSSWGQMLIITIIYNLAYFILHIPRVNLTLFWAIPALISSIQLFYFGTFLPHREPKDGYSEPHRAQTISYPVWWSFLTCYHFGYHEEHHESPHLPWWQLPDAHMLKRSTINAPNM
ncbi:MAG: fatty acid desaturase [Brasilonema octagenarum HA4186-MV1]|jgi:beta-carotene ketolase (CrtW type)|uniref:Beta-carotene ketolase n=2 Tax=Brasilonema TaxID=383614 RepID=A0A856M9Y2_9CYAN|nr:fatty acid desaturase [Brasilonema octagenarum]MBW4627442.1 fatty acid desaturase [Brasilonema octagenarum HA4186-MV1]NMF62630.1 beta-carotene ketolase [Brasilonema octagenarum UFV-OR1]QDL07973.1 beta-carotene ketolase [Brasilonema sennae CENA114]QDL14333.1 beta-carotene ketolase [Brasilonema octagenarum UFV-E1]